MPSEFSWSWGWEGMTLSAAWGRQMAFGKIVGYTSTLVSQPACFKCSWFIDKIAQPSRVLRPKADIVMPGNRQKSTDTQHLSLGFPTYPTTLITKYIRFLTLKHFTHESFIISGWQIKAKGEEAFWLIQDQGEHRNRAAARFGLPGISFQMDSI